ncbi:hypothetical protein ACFFWB_16275 [Flavobacterium procerum]|uniref:hypothetical protein n=1 Tax=Flavobacterium procerum TaxID=1455569 RepID=UPI0035EACB8C
MKKYFKTILILWCAGIINLYPQAGMMTNNPNKNAVLDLNNANGTNTKGLLLPKASLIASDNPSPMTAHIAGMCIYNTSASGSGGTAVSPGMYYNDGTQWLRMPTSSWQINGNTGTNASVNFLGTTDAKDFITKTTDTERMRVSANGNLQIGTSSIPTGGTSAKLIVNNTNGTGALQIIDGSQMEGKILTSDANGLASWESPTIEKPKSVTFGSGVYIPVATPTTAYYYSGTSVTLPPGKWLISVDVLLAKDGGPTSAIETWFVRSTFSNSSTVIAKSGDIVSVAFNISGITP